MSESNSSKTHGDLRAQIASDAIAFIEAVEKVDAAHPNWGGITNRMDPAEATKFEQLQRSVRRLRRQMHVA